MVVFKAMGFESDQEAIQLVGAEEDTLATMAPCLEECQKANVHTQTQVRKEMLLNVTVIFTERTGEDMRECVVDLLHAFP